MEHLNYGVIGNCRSAALISDTGSIDWLCFPDFDSPSVFAKILDNEAGGSFGFTVADFYTITQKYIEHTNILSTVFESMEGGFEVIDFMPRYRINESDNYFLPAEVHRLILFRHGNPRFRVNYQPVLNYAQEKVGHKVGPEYVKTYSLENKREAIYLYSSIDLAQVLAGDEIILHRNEFFLLSYNQKLITINQDRIDLEFQRTKVYWMNWSNRSKKFTKYNEIVERSILVLKLMSYQRSGAVLAALTTSIPESVGEVRNWDYRFCWLRDASMSIETLLRIGHRESAKKFILFVQNILKTKSDSFQIMYGIRGERVLTEVELSHLCGFKNSKPVRIGNGAYGQKQNDSLGYLMDVIYNYYLFFPDTLDDIEDMFEVVKNIVKTVTQDWANPDNGIWEIRGEEKHFVFSKIMSWVAIDRAVSIAKILQKSGFEKRWSQLADDIKSDVLTNGWNSQIESFTQSYGTADLDSSLLLMEAYGFIEADDERYIKTVESIYRSLNYKGLMFRYNIPDDFGIPKSAFTICTFWMIRGLFVIGRVEDANILFEEMIGYSNHLGLFSEDLDFDTKSQLGNFPQAYSHLALINTAALFADPVLTSRFIKP